MGMRMSFERLNKKTIVEMDNNDLINAFEDTVADIAKATYFTSRVPMHLTMQLNWMREEISKRMN